MRRVLRPPPKVNALPIIGVLFPDDVLPFGEAFIAFSRALFAVLLGVKNKFD